MESTIVRILLAAASVTMVAACQPANDGRAEIQRYAMEGSETANLPFSAVVRVDNTLYLSGSIGNVPGEMQLVPGGVVPETRQTMENIKASLALAGATMDDIVKCTVFMADASDWSRINDVYREYFDTFPARSAFGASGLALNAKVEIDCIAVLD